MFRFMVAPLTGGVCVWVCVWVCGWGYSLQRQTDLGANDRSVTHFSPIESQHLQLWKTTGDGLFKLLNFTGMGTWEHREAQACAHTAGLLLSCSGQNEVIVIIPGSAIWGADREDHPHPQPHCPRPGRETRGQGAEQGRGIEQLTQWPFRVQGICSTWHLHRASWTKRFLVRK